MDYCYSLNREDWETDLSDLSDNVDAAIGDVVNVWRGESVPITAQELFDAGDALDMMRDRGYERGGDFAEDYLDDLPKTAAEELDAFLAGWFDKYKMHPRFYSVEKQVKMAAKLTEDGLELIDEPHA